MKIRGSQIPPSHRPLDTRRAVVRIEMRLSLNFIPTTGWQRDFNLLPSRNVRILVDRAMETVCLPECREGTTELMVCHCLQITEATLVHAVTTWDLRSRRISSPRAGLWRLSPPGTTLRWRKKPRCRQTSSVRSFRPITTPRRRSLWTAVRARGRDSVARTEEISRQTPKRRSESPQP